MPAFKFGLHRLLRWAERYTRTDMVYLASSGYWMNLSFVFTSVFSFLLSIAFANLLPKTEYGIYQYVLALSAFLTAFTFTGMNAAITQAVANGREGVFKSSIRIQLIWNTIPGLIALAGGIYYFLNGNLVLGLGLACVALSLPITSAFNSYSAFLNGRKNFRSSAFYGIAGNSIYYICIFSGLLLFPSAAALLLINLMVTAGAAVTLYFVTVQKHRPNHSPDPEAIGYGRHLTFLSVLSTVAAHVDKILVFQFLGAASLASYAIAILLPERLAGAFKSLLYIAFPRFSGREMPLIQSSIVWKAFLLLLLTTFCATAYALFAPLLLGIIYPEYGEIIPYSQVYAFTFVATIGHLVTIVLIAHKRLKELYVLNLTIPIIHVVLQILGIVIWGLWGLIVARLLHSLLFSLLSLGLLLRLRS